MRGADGVGSAGAYVRCADGRIHAYKATEHAFCMLKVVRVGSAKEAVVLHHAPDTAARGTLWAVSQCCGPLIVPGPALTALPPLVLPQAGATGTWAWSRRILLQALKRTCHP